MVALIVGVASTLGAVAVASGPVYIYMCPLRLAVSSLAPSSCLPVLNGGFEPRLLPRRKRTAVEVLVSGTIPSADDPPPLLKKVTVKLDRNGAVDAAGVPACGRMQLESLGPSELARRCRAAVVGHGEAHVAIESLSDPLRLPLTIYNGGLRHGVTTVFIRTLINFPTRTPLIAAVKVRKVNRSRHGLEATAAVPTIAGGRGAVIDFSLTINGPGKGNATPRAYAMARCADGRLQASMESVFENGTVAHANIVRACTPEDPQRR